MQDQVLSKVHSLSAQNFSNKEIAYQLKRSHPALNGLALTEEDVVILRYFAVFLPFVPSHISRGVSPHAGRAQRKRRGGSATTDTTAPNRTEVPMTHEHRERYEPKTPQRREVNLVGAPRARPEGGASPPPLVVAPPLGN